MTTENETSASVEREADGARAGLVGTLDQLRDNLKPANVMDEVMSNVRLGGSTIVESLTRTAREHPIPMLLIGSGIALILGVGTSRMRSSDPDYRDWDRAHREGFDEGSYYRDASGRFVSRGRDAAGRFTSRARGMAADYADQAGDVASGLRRKVGEQASGLSDAVGEKAGQFSEAAAEFGRTASGQIGDAAARLRDTASAHLGDLQQQAGDVYSSVADKARSRYDDLRGQYGGPDMRGTLSRLMQEQPLVIAAAGLAVGAAIGAALPSTDAEDNFMGERAEAIRQSAREIASEQVDRAKSTAAKVVSDVKDTASDHGLSTENLKGLVRDVTETAKSASGDVIGAAKSSIDTVADRAASPAKPGQV